MTDESKDLDEEFRLSLDFPTPHKEFAKPYAGGKTRVLFFMNIGYTAHAGLVAREAVELKQRFDFDAEANYWAYSNPNNPDYHWYGDAAGIARMKRLLEEPWDCAVFWNVSPEMMPVEEQDIIMQRVRQGAGIVFVGLEDISLLKPDLKDTNLPAFLLSGTPFSGLALGQGLSDEEAAAKLVATYSVIEGRVVRLPAPMNLDYQPGWITEYDYWSQLVGRAVLWAAQKEPGIEVGIVLSHSSIEISTLPQPGIKVSFQNNSKLKPLTINVSLRRYDGLRIPLPKETVSNSGGSFVRTIPVLRAGRYFVDVCVMSQLGVEAWGATSFQVICPRTVQDVSLDHSWDEIGGRLSGEVHLSGHPSANQEKVRVDLCDRRDRVIARQVVAPQGNTARFDFPVEAWMPMLIRVEATLLSGEQEMSEAYAFFNVTKRHQGQFNFVVWDLPYGTLAPYGEESLTKLGMTVHLSGIPGRISAAYDIAWVPYTTRILADKDANGYMLPTCWNNEPDINDHVKGIVEAYITTRQHGVFVYSLGDEGVTRGACLHPKCLAAYRNYLQKEYENMDALNKSWGSAYKTFDDITLTLDDIDGLQAKQEGNYPRWYDRQAFECANFVAYCKRYVDTFAQIDPKSRVGFEGAGSFEAGDDFDLIVRTNGFWTPYPGLGDEIIRSIAPVNFPHSNWMGYTKDADSLLSKYWRMITRGDDSVWWWRWDGIYIYHGLLRPDLSPYEAVRDMTQDTQVVRDGLGDLLIKSTMQDDGIAILYSMPSAYATQVGKGQAYGAYATTHVTWSNMIRELGLQYRYITDRMLRRGEFNTSKFKVLILARSEALGSKEAEVIRQFVQNGGTVIADVRPGIYDDHCKLRKTGILDDLFGIKRSTVDAAPVTASATFALDQGSIVFNKINCDPGVQLVGGQASGHCGATPLLIISNMGMGRAILLNFDLNTYPALGDDNTTEAAASIFMHLFAKAGVQPSIRITRTDGTRLKNLETVRWRNGDIEIVALFRESGQSEPGQVALREARYVYNLRDHTSLRKVKTFPTKIIASRATFFALTMHPMSGHNLKLSKRSISAGAVLKANIHAPGAKGLRVMKLTATLPNGQPADWLDQVVMVDPGGASISMPIAYNDPKGKWTVHVTDLYTNRVTKTAFLVR